MGKGFCNKKCAGRARRSALSVASMSARYGHVDKNQAALVVVFEQLGCSVLNCVRVGSGFPDLIIGYRGHDYLVEVKNPTNAYGKRGLNGNQKRWSDTWPSPVFVVRTEDDVIKLVKFLFENPCPKKEHGEQFK